MLLALQVTGGLTGADEASAPTYLSVRRDWSLLGAQMDGNYRPFIPHVMPQWKIHYQLLAAPTQLVNSHEATNPLNLFYTHGC